MPLLRREDKEVRIARFLDSAIDAMTELHSGRFRQFVIGFDFESLGFVADSEQREATALAVRTLARNRRPTNHMLGGHGDVLWRHIGGRRSRETDLRRLPALHAERIRHRQTRKITHSQPVDVVAAAAILDVADLDRVLARVFEGVGQLRVRTQARDIIAVGQLAAFRIEHADHRVEDRSHSPRDDLDRNLLTGFCFELVVLHLQSPDRPINGDRQCDLLSLLQTQIRPIPSDRRQIIDQ